MIVGLVLAAALTASDVPNDATTPGVDNPAVTQQTIGQTICVHNWTKTVRPPASYTNALKVKQLKALGYADQDPSHYEEDHRLSIEDGGDPRAEGNLYPEPYDPASGYGARVKDKLETATSHAICAGTITLEQGRAILKGNWKDAFQRYCGTDPSADCKVHAP
jgi:hypothetical protein